MSLASFFFLVMFSRFKFFGVLVASHLNIVVDRRINPFSWGCNQTLDSSPVSCCCCCLKEKAKYNFSTPTAPSSIFLTTYWQYIHSHKPRGWIKSRFFSFAIKEEEPHDSYATVSFFHIFWIGTWWRELRRRFNGKKHTDTVRLAAAILEMR